MSLDGPGKAEAEKNPLRRIDDSFTKVIITRNGLHAYADDDGVLIMDLLDFLLDRESLPRFQKA